MMRPQPRDVIVPRVRIRRRLWLQLKAETYLSDQTAGQLVSKILTDYLDQKQTGPAEDRCDELR